MRSPLISSLCLSGHPRSLQRIGGYRVAKASHGIATDSEATEFLSMSRMAGRRWQV